jgi:SAM-dependent methyltransferase
MATSTWADNASVLRRRFLDRLLAQNPTSVLDVGCGPGFHLAGCREAGIPAVGVETYEEDVASLRARGHEVVRASAEQLPFPDLSFDWVTMRHVAHHLEDLEGGLREAARVAKSGVVIAEPWRDALLPCQELGLRYDRWLKRQDRRLGRVHATERPPAHLLELLPTAFQCDAEWETFQRLGSRPLEDVQASMEERLTGLPDDHADRIEYADILSEASQIGVGHTGTAILVARRH